MKFVALDTETYKGKAFLLSTATEAFPISSFSAFQKIVFGYSKDTRFVFYNLDYDISALVKFLPRRIAAQIYLDRAVKHGAVWLRYIPGKVFSIVKDGRKVECFDVLPFFQCSLDEAANKYLGLRKYKVSDSGIDISNLSPAVYAANKNAIDSYAIQDSYLLQMLVDNLQASIDSTGIKLKALYSPGYLAKCYLKKERIRIEPCPHEYIEDVTKCYHGGRIEVLRRGYFSNVAIYDLKSAYPSAMKGLPNLSHATFSRSTEIKSLWDLVKIRTSQTHPTVSPLALKRNGLLIFPSVNGTLWTTALEALQLGKDVEIIEAINVLVPNDEKPFADLIDRLFAMRKRSGMEGLVYKLILNSLYGVTAEHRKQYRKAELDKVYRKLVKENARAHFENFAQTVAQKCPNGWKYFDGACKCDWCKAARSGSKQVSRLSNEVLLEFEGSFWRTVKDNGAMANKLLATYITAITRVKMYEALSTVKRPIAAFTDSIIMEEDSNFSPEATGKLGSWEKKYTGPCLLIGAGVYETDEETKFRGFRIKRQSPEDRPLNHLLGKMDGTSIGVPQKMRHSFGQSIRTSFENYEEFNVITDIEKKLDVNFDRKREWARSFESGADVLANQIDSSPLSIKTKEGYNEKHRDSLRMRT